MIGIIKTIKYKTITNNAIEKLISLFFNKLLYSSSKYNESFKITNKYTIPKISKLNNNKNLNIVSTLIF